MDSCCVEEALNKITENKSQISIRDAELNILAFVSVNFVQSIRRWRIRNNDPEKFRVLRAFVVSYVWLLNLETSIGLSQFVFSTFPFASQCYPKR